MMNKQILLATVFVAVIVSVSLLAVRTETQEVYYPTSEAAVADGAVLRGWIPDWLPRSAVDIHEIHNLDSNRSMLAFRFVRAEKMEFEAVCERIEPTKQKEPPFSIEWWPRDVPANKSPTYRHLFYSCEGGEAFLAMPERTGEAFYWRP